MTQLGKLGTPLFSAKRGGRDCVSVTLFRAKRATSTRTLIIQTRGADINVAVSHPVGRWQIDEINFTAEMPR